ncbi:hypothetical protein ENUP19_0128G0033 [Entamoeba nuttalli]|uniref:Uncharacterized protein n=2 Tax=Entamoeba nuttalli TaxID=412467 RepID=K2HZ38_ENTNP|nr:hypothetical protein ENU1_048100 [Entamoeba nuttalli P19]EKE41675.1 hypothetical protein ENU1_048100 [Entamoeba nuttalli P19]|eukprot:XP_008856000.1 hypothetical protein ENU1_048100 [Entamoeba nuttalli P19]
MLTSKRGGLVYDKEANFNEPMMRNCVGISHFFVFDVFDKALCFLDKVVQIGCYGDAATSQEKHKIWVKRICSNNEYNKGKEKTSKVGCGAHAFVREVQLRTIIHGTIFKKEQVIFNFDNNIYSTHKVSFLPLFEPKMFSSKYQIVMKKKVVLVTIGEGHSAACKQQMQMNCFQLKHKKEKQPKDLNEKGETSIQSINPPLQSPFVICQQPFLQSDSKQEELHDNSKCAFTQGVVNYDGRYYFMCNEDEMARKYLSRIDSLTKEVLADIENNPYDQRLQLFIQLIQNTKKAFVQ